MIDARKLRAQQVVDAPVTKAAIHTLVVDNAGYLVDNTAPTTGTVPLYINDDAGLFRTQDLAPGQQIGGENIHPANGGSYYRTTSLASSALPNKQTSIVTDDTTPEFNGSLDEPADAGDVVVVYTEIAGVKTEIGRSTLDDGAVTWKIQSSAPFSLGTHTLSFSYFDAAGNESTGITNPVNISGTNFPLTSLTIVPLNGTQVVSDGTIGTNALTTYINAVTGTDIVSDAEFDAGFSISGMINTTTVTDYAKLKFYLDNNRTGTTPTVELGQELVNGVNGVSIDIDHTTGAYTISFGANSSVLLQANQTTNTTPGTTQGGSGVHKLSVSYDSAGDGHQLGSTDTSGDVLVSRLFLVANGTAAATSLDNTGGTVAGINSNFSVVDIITGKTFVYYYGDPDGAVGLGGAWTQADPYGSSNVDNRSTLGEGALTGDWDYWSKNTAPTGTPVPADYALGTQRINLDAKVWEFAALRPVNGTPLTWTEANAAALNHSLTQSNTSRLGTLEEMVALYAANFGANNGSFAGFTRVVGDIQPLTEAVNSNSTVVNEEWNQPTGWGSQGNMYWTSTASVTGYAGVAINTGAVIDRANDTVEKMAAFIIL